MSDAAELSSDPRPEDAGHLPVLPRQVLDLLAPAAGMVCLDCTVGRAGHAKLIAPQLAPGGTYVGLDVDPVNVAYAADQLRAAAPESVTTHVVKSNFAAARQVLDLLGIGKVNLLLADLGFASSQMSDPSRGLSFAADGPLDMRLDPDLRATAADLVNHLPERELADLIYRFGEERHSRRIARIIGEERTRSPILTTRRLAQIVRGAAGGSVRGRGRSPGRIDPATRTFMALRIAVNGELDALEQLLKDLPNLVAVGGRAAFISFHSLEDRLVKHAFIAMKQRGQGTILTKKPITADEAEQRENPRSRSAKLRCIELV